MDKLKTWRKQIDKIDHNLLELLSKRMEIVRKIGQLKNEQDIPLRDQTRWREILKSNLTKSTTLRLSKDFIETFLNFIHEYSLKIQKRSL